MAKLNIDVVAINGAIIPTMVGVRQSGFVDGDVWRVCKFLYADVSAYSGCVVSGETPTDTQRWFNMLDALLEPFNAKYGCNLKARDYDVARGKYSRERPLVAKVAEVATQATTATPIMAIADASAPVIDAVVDWCLLVNKDHNMTPSAIRSALKKSGHSDASADAHLLRAFPVPQLAPVAPVASSVPLPPA